MQIKVTDTRMYKTIFSTPLMSKQIEIPVAEAQLVLVEATKEDVENFKGTRLLQNGGLYNGGWIKPILFSVTEKIEMEDWIWDSYDRLIYQHDDRTDLHKHTHKILALPEHLSPKHLQAIVDGKMKDGDKVLVECDERKLEGIRGDISKIIKLNSSNHITLHKVEEKMYSKEEVIDIITTYRDFKCDTVEDAKKQYPKLFNSRKDESITWFEQNVK